MPLLPAALLERLSAMTLRSRDRGAGSRGGEHASTRRGRSLEFADHRPYTPGDDLRFLDVHLQARLDALWIRLFEEEEDRVVQLLVDASASMEGEKLAYARQLAGALAWVALGRSDRVAVGGVSDKLVAFGPPRRGRGAARGTFDVLEGIHPGGGTDIAAALERWPRQQGSGVAVLLTDLLYPEGPDRALRRLLARGNEVHVLHVLAPADLRPALSGDLVLVDAETGEELALTVDSAALDRYESTVRAWSEEMRVTCERLGVGYVRLPTDLPLDEALFGALRRHGLLAR